MGIKERKEREKNRRRTEILDAARELFFKNGPENTTMDDVAEKVELSKGTLYLYFPSKEALQYEVTLSCTEVLRKVLMKAIDNSKSGLDNLVQIGWAFIDFSRNNVEYINLFMRLQVGDLKSSAISSEKIEQYLIEESPFTILIDLVNRGINDGSLRKDLPVENVATTLWSTMLGLNLVQSRKKELYRIFKVDEINVLSTAFELIINGISNKSNG